MSANELKWPAVVVIVSMMVVLGGLSWAGKDPTPVLGGILAVLAAMGFGYMNNKQNETNATLSAVKEQTNGGYKGLMQMVEQSHRDQIASNERHRRDMREMAERLAAMTPAAVTDPVPVSGGGVYADRENGHPPNL